MVLGSASSAMMLEFVEFWIRERTLKSSGYRVGVAHAFPAKSEHTTAIAKPDEPAAVFEFISLPFFFLEMRSTPAPRLALEQVWCPKVQFRTWLELSGVSRSQPLLV